MNQAALRYGSTNQAKIAHLDSIALSQTKPLRALARNIPSKVAYEGNKVVSPETYSHLRGLWMSHFYHFLPIPEQFQPNAWQREHLVFQRPPTAQFGHCIFNFSLSEVDSQHYPQTSLQTMVSWSQTTWNMMLGQHDWSSIEERSSVT